jgi:Tol biopolymer transport system component
LAAVRRRARQSIAVLALLCIVALGGCSDNSATVKIRGVEMVDQPGVGVAAWSPDSRWIAIPTRHGIVLRTPEGETRTIEAPPLRTSFGTPAQLSFSRDGRWLRYMTAAGPERGRGLWATQVRRDGSGVSQTPLGTELAFPAWAPGGWPLVFATGLYEFEPDGSQRGPLPSLRRLSGPNAQPEILTRTAGKQPEEPVVSANGRRVLFKQWIRGHTELWMASADGSQRRLARALFIRHPQWSPDRRRIAYAAYPRHGSEGARLFTVAATGGGKPRRVGNELVAYGPTWTPDGRWLTFSTPAGEIKRIHPDGSGIETIADFDGEEVRGLLWSPNGRYLAYEVSPPPNEDFD